MLNTSQYLSNLNVPNRKIDVILDTDAYNEIDDQYAISYMLSKSDNFNIKAICAAPFFNSKVKTVSEGMLKSYDEILKLLDLSDKQHISEIVYKGSEDFLINESTPQISESSKIIASLSDNYSPETPLYIIAIGAITNVASAILMNPAIIENCVLVWLGGHATHIPMAASEFNMRQDIAASRIVFECGIPLVMLPCKGVVDRLTTSKYELEHWLSGKNKLCDYLYLNTVKEADSYAEGKPWTRVIWDISAVSWLLNTDGKFMKDKLIPSPIPEYDKQYAFDDRRHFIKYVYSINRDAIFEDLFNTLGN